MITKIVAKLKTGSITNVVPFGSSTLPVPPYVVVKPEKDPLERGRLFRIIPHFQPGQQVWLELYLFEELTVLLSDYQAESRYGNTNNVLAEQDWTDIIANNDDGTISMERVFLVPMMLHY